MKKLLLGFALLFLAVCLGSKFAGNSGYILLTYHNWSVEISLWFAMISLLLFLFLLFGFFRLFSGLRNIISNWRLWMLRRRTARNWYFMHKGFTALIEAKFRLAQKLLEKAALHGDRPLMLLLAAAKAARARGRFKDQDVYLEKARQCADNDPLVIALAQAKWELEDKQFAQALLILKPLLAIAPCHPQVLNFLHMAYFGLQDWQSLRDLLPHLAAARFLSREKLEALEFTVYQAVLKQAFHKGASEEIAKLWKSLPKRLQKHASFISDYCEYLINQKQHWAVEHLLQRALKKQWDSRLVQLYGRVKSNKPLAQLALAKTWLKTHANDPDLLFCLGCLSSEYALWGQARDYLEASIREGNETLARYELAKVLEHLGDPMAALRCYKKLVNQMFFKTVQEG